VVFDRPPSPEAPRFLDVEDDEERLVRFGEWLERDDGAWVLRLPNQLHRARRRRLLQLGHDISATP
jgi:hypothetical protein